MSNLNRLISDLYPAEMSETDIAFASKRLISFFEILSKIDQRLKQEELILGNLSNNKVNLYDNNGSSNPADQTK